jgi:hypothetical protein
MSFRQVLVAVVAARSGYNQGSGGPPSGGHGSGGQRPGGHGSGGQGSDHSGEGSNGGNHSNWATKLCANSSLAQSFLTQTQQLITDFQSNGSYTQVLQSRAQEISYVQDANNANLLSSNCTGFFVGLGDAQSADKLAEDQQKQAARTAGQLLIQIIVSLVGGGNSGNYN